MFDAKLFFSNKQDAFTTNTESTNFIDLGQESPDLGMLNCPELHITVYPTKAFEASGAATLQVQVLHADDNGSGTPKTFEALTSSPAVDAKTFDGIDIQLPIQHKRYLKLKYVTTGTPSAGQVTAGITDGTQKNPWYKIQI